MRSPVQHRPPRRSLLVLLLLALLPGIAGAEPAPAQRRVRDAGLSKWTTVKGAVVQGGVVHGGAWAARLEAAGAPAYLRRTLGTTPSEIYARTFFSVQARSTQATLLALLAPDRRPILRVGSAFRGTPVQDRRSKRDQKTLSVTGVSGSAWHELQLHARVNGKVSTTEVWLDGVRWTTSPGGSRSARIRSATFRSASMRPSASSTSRSTTSPRGARSSQLRTCPPRAIHPALPPSPSGRSSWTCRGRPRPTTPGRRATIYATASPWGPSARRRTRTGAWRPGRPRLRRRRGGRGRQPFVPVRIAAGRGASRRGREGADGGRRTSPVIPRTQGSTQLHRSQSIRMAAPTFVSRFT